MPVGPIHLASWLDSLVRFMTVLIPICCKVFRVVGPGWAPRKMPGPTWPKFCGWGVSWTLCAAFTTARPMAGPLDHVSGPEALCPAVHLDQRFIPAFTDDDALQRQPLGPGQRVGARPGGMASRRPGR